MTVANVSSRDEAVGGAALMTRERRWSVVLIAVVSVVIFLFSQGIVPLPVLFVAIAFGLYPLAKTGLVDLIKERKIGTEIFVTIATLIAVVGGETIAGAVLMVIILIAEFIADLNTDRARASIRGLIGSVPQTALVRDNGTERTAPIDQLRPGDIVLVRAGDKVPVDGTVVAGGGAVNEAPITGESLPKDKGLDAQVFAGTILESGALDVRTDRVGGDTTFGRIVKLVEEAEESQAPVQRLADRVAAWLIPVVLVFLVIVFIVTHDVRKIVTLMIFTSPAELGLATPMVMIAAIARAARSGILVKGGAFLETLAKVDVLVFDKTGTLTAGRPVLETVIVLDPALREDDIVRAAAAADRRSGHPLAKAVVKRAIQGKVQFPEPTTFDVFPGRGVRATVDGAMVLVGNELLMTENQVSVAPNSGQAGRTTVYVAIAGKLVGALQIVDPIRPRAKEAIAKLRASGIKRVMMLTGDNAATADAVSSQLGLDEAVSGLLPENKAAAISRLRDQGHRVAMVGDGVNDAPALATADVGVAMGAGGTQAAIEAADVALMQDDLSKIVTARDIARKAYRTIQENLFFGVGVVHVLGIVAALRGWIGPVQAAVIHLGPDLLVFLNSVKLLRLRLEE